MRPGPPQTPRAIAAETRAAANAAAARRSAAVRDRLRQQWLADPQATVADVAMRAGTGRRVAREVRIQLEGEELMERRRASRPMLMRATKSRLVICQACGLRRLRHRDGALPAGWEDEPFRCGECVAEGRVVNPITIRWTAPAPAVGPLLRDQDRDHDPDKSGRQSASQAAQVREAVAA